jgi:hypothetical protein
MSDIFVARRELLERAGSQRLKLLGGVVEPLECRAPRLVGKRDRDLGSACERLQECPFRRGQVLEAIREDRLALPGAQVACKPLGGRRPQEVAVPKSEAVELVAIRRVQTRQRTLQVVRRDQPSLDLGDRVAQRIGEAG